MQYKIGLLALVSATIMSFTFSSKLDFRPPGTVEVVDNFFYDESEIRNIDWKEYLSFIQYDEGIESSRYQKALPDTTVWLEGEFLNEPLVQLYFSHPSYNDYPVVGVSHQQATEYCAWRTEAVKTMLKENNMTAPKSFEYRLPTKTEWELMANAGMSKKSKKYHAKRIEKQQQTENSSARIPLANLQYEKIVPSNKDDLTTFRTGMFAICPAPTLTYLPNKYGVYNIFGNVAEMIEDPGIAVGGSYIHYYNEIVPENKVVKYESPKNWLGFRCVCEIIEK